MAVEEWQDPSFVGLREVVRDRSRQMRVSLFSTRGGAVGPVRSRGLARLLSVRRREEVDGPVPLDVRHRLLRGSSRVALGVGPAAALGTLDELRVDDVWSKPGLEQGAHPPPITA